ncbi:hypothetical protein [Halorubrum sp. N11]
MTLRAPKTDAEPDAAGADADVPLPVRDGVTVELVRDADASDR